jgi:hypothetical protein
MKQINDHRSLHEWYTSKQAEKHPLRERQVMNGVSERRAARTK